MKRSARTFRPITFAMLLVLLVIPAGIAGAAEEEGGNNLSMPAIWADGGSVAIRSTDPTPNLVDADLVPSATGTLVYPQGANSTWMADNVVNPSGASLYVTLVDWGDNLEAKAWPTNAAVRVETTLLKTLIEPMTAYEMLLVSGQGTTESWGATGTTFESTTAHVFSGAALLTIQRIDPKLTYTWSASATEWIGAPVVYEGKATAETNIKGNVVYGYNWRSPATAGTYRITFSVPPTADTSFAFASIAVPTEEAITAFLEADRGPGGQPVPPGGRPGKPGGGGGRPTGGGVAYVDAVNNLTYIDVTITTVRGGRR